MWHFNWSKGRCHSSHEIRICQHNIAQCRFLLAVFDTRQLDNVANLHIRRQGHFTTFTVQTIFQRLIKIFRLFQAKALLVPDQPASDRDTQGSPNNRTIHCTDQYILHCSKLFSLILFCCIFMIVIHFIKLSATNNAVSMETPAPQPSCIVLSRSNRTCCKQVLLYITLNLYPQLVVGGHERHMFIVEERLVIPTVTARRKIHSLPKPVR